MGIFESKLYPSDRLHDEIIKEVEKLMNEYEFWTFDSICPRLEILYYDKLIKLDKTDLFAMVGTIGVKQDNNYCKENLCKIIIGHYKKRFNLLKCIFEGLNKSHEIIYKIRTGGGGGSCGVCAKVDSYINNIKQCEEYKGLWVTQEQYQELIQRVKNDKTYGNWDNIVDELEVEYFKYLEKLKKIVNKLKNGQYLFKDKQLDQFGNYTREVIRRMIYVCEIYYLLAINVNLI